MNVQDGSTLALAPRFTNNIAHSDLGTVLVCSHGISPSLDLVNLGWHSRCERTVLVQESYRFTVGSDDAASRGRTVHR